MTESKYIRVITNTSTNNTLLATHSFAQAVFLAHNTASRGIDGMQQRICRHHR